MLSNILANEDDEDLTNSNTNTKSKQTAITLDTIASFLLKNKYILTALELHTELAENGHELGRLRDYFSNPSNFEQQQHKSTTNNGFYPLHKTPSIQTFDSLDLTRYSDDVDNLSNNNMNSNGNCDSKLTLLEFELRKAKETINQLRYTLTIATENDLQINNKESKTTNTCQTNGLVNSNSNSKLNKPLMNNLKQNILLPHEKNAINFLINEYLLLENYKMTSVTFSEENESQDLEDWDVVGLNRSKPPNLINLFRTYYNTHTNEYANNSVTTVIKEKLNLIDKNNQTEETIKDMIDFNACVNFDLNLINNQNDEIKKLNEKNLILLNKIDTLQNEIEKFSDEREVLIKKIDSLATINSDLKKKNQNSLNETETSVSNNGQLESNNEKYEKYEKIKFDRKIPVLYKEALNKYTVMKLSDENERILKCMDKLNLNHENLSGFLAKCLPNIVPNVLIQKRIELIPMIVYAAILQENSNERDSLLKMLFNLFKKPDSEQRSMILIGCLYFAKFAGPDRVNNELLPQFWEEIVNKHEEIRCMIAEACAILAPYIAVDIRSSLILSILKQIIIQDTSEEVRISATKSLGVLVNYLQDVDKFQQCIELLNNCLNDTNGIKTNTYLILVPSLALWSVELNKLHSPFMDYYVKQIDVIFKNDNTKMTISDMDEVQSYLYLLKTLTQYLYLNILYLIKNNNSINESQMHQKHTESTNFLLNCKYTNIISDLYNLDLIIDNKNEMINIMDSLDLNNLEFNKYEIVKWIENDLLKILIKLSNKIDAFNILTNDLIDFFTNFTFIFGLNYTKEKIIPIFEEIISSTADKDDENSSNKSIISIYFISILCNYYIINDEISDENFQYLNNYLKNILFSIGLKQLNISCLIVIYEHLSKNGKSTHLQVLLSTLWDGIVHESIYVRCYTAKLFEILVKNIDETILSNRVLPALITLANDQNKCVRCESISPLCSVIENCSNKEILERVYVQLQSFLSDPILKEDYDIRIELIKAFIRIANKIDAKFREEFILPYMTILTMQTLQAQHALLSLNEQKANKIAILLYDAYNSVSNCTVSRQSIQESLIPGLNCLKQIMTHDYEKLKVIDQLIYEFEVKIQQQNSQLNDSLNTSTTSPSINSLNNTPNTLEHNFKYMVFKGITNSKDKFSNFLNKKH